MLETRPASSPSSSPGARVDAGGAARPDAIAEVAAALRAIHGGGPLPATLRRVRTSSSTTRADRRERGGDAPPARSATLRERRARGSSAALDRAPSTRRCRATTTCCPPTSSTTARRLRIVDWEYAGMGDRYFDLGNLSVNNGFNEADDEWLLERLLRRAVHAPAARGAAADADHVGLPRGDVGRRAGGDLRARLRLRRLRRTSTSSACAAALADPRFGGLARGRAWPTAELPARARCVIVGGGRRRRRRSPTTSRELGWRDVVLRRPQPAHQRLDVPLGRASSASCAARSR